MTRYKVIDVEDTKESMTNALKEMHQALMKGSGVGFDLRKIKPEERQASIVKEMDQQYVKSTIGIQPINHIKAEES